jgi:hypothetical protein
MTFQRLIDSVLGGLPFAFVYLDDILIASPDPSSHRPHMEAVFTVLQSNGLIVNPEKCLFACPEMGNQPTAGQGAGHRRFPPTTVKHLQAFLGLFNFYMLFYPSGGTDRAAPDQSIMRWPEVFHPSSGNKGSLSSGQTRPLIFSSSGPHSEGTEISLVTDASATHLGAAIQQRSPRQVRRLLRFFSAQLDKAQVNYSAFNRELLEVVAAIRHCRYMLEGCGFVVFTDPKPLVGALHRRSDLVSARQQRHLSFIAEFAPTIRHITGKYNIVADTLSRPAAVYSGPGAADTRSTEVKPPSRSSVPPATAGPGCPPPPVDLVALAAPQLSCPDCQDSSSSALRVSEILMQGVPILVDTSSGLFCP